MGKKLKEPQCKQFDCYKYEGKKCCAFCKRKCKEPCKNSPDKCGLVAED